MIDPTVLRAMLNAGVTAEQIVVAVEAMCASEEKSEAERRAKNAERMRNIRARSRTTALVHAQKEKSPIPSKEKTTPLRDPSDLSWSSGFEEFWKAYPRKIAKPKALKAFHQALKKGATVEAIMAGLKRYCRSVAGKEPEFIAHAASWLNADRWLDEDDAKKPSVINGAYKTFVPEPDFKPPSPEEIDRRNKALDLIKDAARRKKVG